MHNLLETEGLVYKGRCVSFVHYSNLGNNASTQLRTQHLFLQEQKMKVTLLIAVCTLVVLLQQMQTPMAQPQKLIIGTL